MQTIDELLTRYPIISDQVSAGDLRLILTELQSVLGREITGDIVELGCYTGTTSLFIQRILNQYGGADRTFHVYDSFMGLPPKQQPDASALGTDFKEGALAVSKQQLLHEFQRANLHPPIIHKGWFEELKPTDVPEKIAFALLDGDFYNSILVSLKLVWPRMNSGSAVLIDDYSNEALPGVAKAVHDFFQGRIQPTLRVAQSIAVMHL